MVSPSGEFFLFITCHHHLAGKGYRKCQLESYKYIFGQQYFRERGKSGEKLVANWTPPSVTRTLRRIVNFNHTDHHCIVMVMMMMTITAVEVKKKITRANQTMMMAMFDALSNVRVWRLDYHARMAPRAT